MGLGKTVQMLALLLASANASSGPQRSRRRRKRLDRRCSLPDVGARQLGARGSSASRRAWRARRTTAASACAAAIHARAARGAISCSRPTRSRRATASAGRRQVGATRARRGAEHQVERRQADTGDPLARRAPSRRADRHAGRESPHRACTRSWTFSTPGCSARPRAFKRGFATPIERYRDARRDEAPAPLRPARSSCAG